MAINRVDYPANLTAQSDFSEHGELIETRFMDQVNAPQWVVSGNIPQGVVLQIGAVVYRADSDTAITGTASDYVKITPDGATAAAAYEPDLTGVTWSAQYNGYYDASENLYVFDEGKALAAGEISAVFGRYLMQQPNGDVAVGRDLDVERNLTVGGTAGVTGNTTVGGTLGVTGALSSATLNTGHGANNLYAMNQNVRTTDSPSFAGVTVNGGIAPSQVSTGTQSISPGATYTLPRGVWVIVQLPDNDGMKLELLVSGVWRRGRYNFEGTVFSNGSNARMYNSVGTRSFAYIRF